MTTIDTTRILQQSLSGLSMRQRATANDTANVDTPGYRANQIPFEGQFARAVDRQRSRQAGLKMVSTSPAHLSAGPQQLADDRPAVSELDGMSYRNDGNSVDIEREKAALAET